jgi:four helix bundle protein
VSDASEMHGKAARVAGAISGESRMKLISQREPKVFALQIIRLFSRLPKTAEGQIIGKQLLRSGTSVGANYREAYRGRSKAEFVSKCGDCLREIEETAYWLDLLAEANLVPQERLQAIRQECRELIAIFVTIVKRSRESS